MNKKGMNKYIGGIMLSLIVAAIIILLYAVAKDAFSSSGSFINEIGSFLGI